MSMTWAMVCGTILLHVYQHALSPVHVFFNSAEFSSIEIPLQNVRSVSFKLWTGSVCYIGNESGALPERALTNGEQVLSRLLRQNIQRETTCRSPSHPDDVLLLACACWLFCFRIAIISGSCLWGPLTGGL